MSKEMKLIPGLRFPEFEKDGEWLESSINELCDILNNIRKPVTSTDRIPGEYPYYGASGIIDYIDQYLFDERLLLIGEDGAKWGAYDNTAFLVEGKYWVNNHAHVLKPVGIDDKLLESYLVRLNLNPYITGAAPPKLTLRKLKEIPIPVPSTPEEQQKIASCLSSLDELIAAHNDKLAALKDHKKGLLQNLFPQEGETLPKVRFPEFEGDGEWVEKKLGGLIEIKGRIGYRGYTRNDIVDKGEGAISMSPSNIDENGHLNFEKSTYITWEKYDESPEIMLKEGFTVLVKTGSSFGKVAYIQNLLEKTTINPQLVVLKPKSINEKFLFLLCIGQTVQQQINETVVGGAIPTLSQSSISNFDIRIPKSPKEQQKIASCLSAVDELITAQQEKIEQLQQHKKGLMQGLFPKMVST
ncbi:MAG: restriction endonuclease subunit S [Bacteroidota bacterium]|nr:restriction endonuclease subunit S [Bacteroidota bacterium]